MEECYFTFFDFEKLHRTFFRRVVEDNGAVNDFKKDRKVIKTPLISSPYIFCWNIVTP